MSCSKLYTNPCARAFVSDGKKTPLIVFKSSVHAKIQAQLAAVAAPEDELTHKPISQAGAEYKCGIPDLMIEYTRGKLRVSECIEENKKTGFAIILSSNQAIVTFGRRAFSNWCPYPVDGCGTWNEARFKAACATVFLDDENHEKVMLDIMLAATPADVQKATKGIAKFDAALWDSKAAAAMYDALLLTCTNAEFFNMMTEVAAMIRDHLHLSSLVGAVEFVESSQFDGLWGNKFAVRDFVDAVLAEEEKSSEFNLLDAAKEGFAGKGGKNLLGAVLTAIMHTVVEIGDYDEFKALVHAENLVVVKRDDE